MAEHSQNRKRQISDSLKLKAFADDNFKLMAIAENF